MFLHKFTIFNRLTNTMRVFISNILEKMLTCVLRNDIINTINLKVQNQVLHFNLKTQVRFAFNKSSLVRFMEENWFQCNK